MYLVNSNRVCFVHIPKNGGNTIQKYIISQPKQDIVLRERIYNNKLIQSYFNSHLTYSELNKKYGNDYDFSFAVIRNPYTRFLSIYRYLSNERFLEMGCYIRSQITELFLSKSNPIDCLKFLSENNNNLFFSDRFGLTQCEFIKSNSGKKIDYLGLFENLPIFIDFILEKINKKKSHIDYKKINSSGDKFNELLSDTEYQKLITKLYSDDIILYNKLKEKHDISRN